MAYCLIVYLILELPIILSMKKLQKSLGLKPQGGNSIVFMASGKLNAPILGKILGNLEIQERKYFDVTQDVVPDLCSDIVLGQSFMSKHKEVTFK